MSSKNLTINRKVLISNLPQDTTSNEIIQELFESQNFKYSNINFDGSSAIVTLANVNEAKRAAKLINGQLFKGTRIFVTEAPPPQTLTPSSGGSPLVLVGNLSFDFTEGQFKDLMSPHGEIKNVFLVRGKISKKSKGYGFIEYKHKESATKAKEHFMKTDAKFVDGRIIRVETVSPSVTVGEAKHSRTLFVDKLPKSFEDEEQLINVFSSMGTVTFCKVARTKQGQPRGYALIDYSTVLEAERGQEKLDGTQIDDSNIRISFCTPGKTAQDIFARFDDPNHRQLGGGLGRGLGRGQASVRPGMVGPRGPRIPNLMSGNANPLMGGLGGRQGFPQPGPLRTPFGIGGMPVMPRPPMDMMLPRPPLLGPNPIGPPGPLPGPLLRVPLSQPGPNIRGLRIRTPGIRTMRPNIKPGQGVRKIRPNNRTGVITLKPRTNAAKKTPDKANELANKVKEEVSKMLGQAKEDAKKDNEQGQVNDQKVTKETPKAKETASEPAKSKGTVSEKLKVKKVEKGTVSEQPNVKKVGKGTVSEQPKVKKVENAQPKEEEKPKVSTPDSLAVLQKLGESAVAAVTTQPSDDGVKVLQPVVFMDTEQFKQFQQFQELMKTQKQAEKSGDSKAISLEDLVVAAKGMKEAENQKTSEQTSKPEPTKPSVGSKQPQPPQKALPQKHEMSKQTPQKSGPSKPLATKPSPVVSKSSSAQAKPSPASTKPSPASTKPSPASTKPSPASTKPSPASTKPSPASTKPSPTSTKPSPASTKPSPTSTKPSPASTKPSPASTKPSPASTKPSPASTKPSPVSTKPSTAATKPSPTTIKPSPATIKLSPAIANSSSIPARHSPVVSRPSLGASKSNTASKSSPATSKPSSAPARSTQSKQETQRPVQRQEKSTTSSHNSYHRPSQHHQRSPAEGQKSIKAVGSYEHERKQYDRHAYHDSKPANTTSRNDGPSSSLMPPPPKQSVEANFFQKLFDAKPANKQDYGSDQRTTTNQADSRSPYGSPYQSGGKSSSPVSEVPRGSPKSSQQSQYGYNQQCQSTDGRDYASKRSPANERGSPVPQSNLRSRYTLPERLPQARGNGEPSNTSLPRYERQPERELISYPRPRSVLPPRQDPPSARDMNPPYGTSQTRGPIEPRDSQRDMRSIRDAVVTRNLASLRDILPPRDNSPISRDTLPPRDRSPRDYLQRDLPPRDVSPRNLPPRDVPPRDMPRTRDSLPPRDSLLPRDMLPPRGMPPRDDRSVRDPYMREMQMPREREPAPYNNSPSRYQTSPASSLEVLDRARFERVMTGARDSRSDYPAYGREPEPRYGGDLPSRESAMGTIRGPPARYPMDGPQNKRPRY